MARKPKLWNDYKALNRYVYGALRARYPRLVIFSTIQYEHVLGLHTWSAELQERMQDVYPNILQNEVRELLWESDILALSTYPYMLSGNVVDDYYYADARSMAREMRKSIAIEQTGFLSRNITVQIPEAPQAVTLFGSEVLQEVFFSFLLQRASAEKYLFVINFIPIDYGTNYGTTAEAMTWAYTGLRRPDNSAKRALTIWRAFRDLSYLPPW